VCFCLRRRDGRCSRGRGVVLSAVQDDLVRGAVELTLAAAAERAAGGETRRLLQHPERRLSDLAVGVASLDDLDDDCCALANQERSNLLRDYNLLAG
jgi:hypothetical protein